MDSEAPSSSSSSRPATGLSKTTAHKRRGATKATRRKSRASEPNPEMAALDHLHGDAAQPDSRRHAENDREGRASLHNDERENNGRSLVGGRDVEMEFVDEEAMFNMPLLLDSMAEGMLLTPPAMKKGFSWTQDVDDHNMDLTLWRD